MRPWHEEIQYEFTDLFSGEDRPEFPAPPEDESGIRIAADGLEHDGAALELRLMVTYVLPIAYEERLQSVERALTLIIEHPSTGRCEAFGLEDPHKRYPPRDGPNLRAGDAGALAGPDDDTSTGFLEVPLRIELKESEPQPALFLRVVLEQLVSNTLAIDVAELQAQSYMHGELVELERIGLDDDEGEEEGEEEDEGEDDVE